MALEDLTGPNKYITDLVASNPVGTDDRAEGDDHMRGTKNVLRNSFPNVAGAVSSSHIELSQLAGYDTGAGSISDRLDNSDAHSASSSIHFADVVAAGLYGRTSAGWTEITGSVGDVSAHIADQSIHFEDVVADGQYVRVAGGWVAASGGGTATLDINTAGTSNNVDLDLNIYIDSGGIRRTLTNDEMSFNILGSSVGKSIGVKIGSSAIVNICVVGKNGQAHGWLSATAVEGQMGWSGDSYTQTATVVFYERGPDVAITPSKTVRVIKSTSASAGGDHAADASIHFEDVTGSAGTYGRGSAGNWVPLSGAGSYSLDVNTSGTSTTVNLDYNVYQDSGGGKHVFTNDPMSFTVVGSVENRTIGVKIGGGSTVYTLAVVGKNGNAHGYLSAVGVESVTGWGGDNYSNNVSVQFVESSTGNVLGTRTVSVTKTTVISEGAPATGGEFLWQEAGLGRRDLSVRTHSGFVSSWKDLEFYAAGQVSSAYMEARARNHGQSIGLGYTSAKGTAIGKISGSWCYSWGWTPNAVDTMDIYIGGALKGSQGITYILVTG